MQGCLKEFFYSGTDYIFNVTVGDTSILFEGCQSSVGFYFSYIAIAVLRKGKVKGKVRVK